MEDEDTMSSWKATMGAILALVLAQAIVFLPPSDIGPNPIPSAAGTHQFFAPWLNTAASSKNGLFLLGDPLLQMQPWRVHMRQVVSSGNIPYWNHLNGLGQPFLANPQTRTLYPLNWIYLLGDEMDWQLPFLAFHVFLFGAGVIFLLRRFGVGFLGMSVAGISSACFGMQIIWLLSPHATTFAWFPWLLVGAERALKNFDRRALLLSAGATALMLLAGHPETAFKSMIAVWLFVVGRLLTERQPFNLTLRVVASLALAQLIGVLLAMPQILPFLEYVSQSESLLMRQQEAAYPPLDNWRTFGRESLTWISQIASISAHGNDLAEENWWLEKVNLREVGLIYGGLVAGLLGVAGLVQRHKLSLPLILVGLFAAIVTFRVPYLYPALMHLPGLDVGANQRFSALIAFVLSLGSGLAIDSLVKGIQSARRIGLLLSFVALVMITAIVVEFRADGPVGDGQNDLFRWAMIGTGLMTLAVGAALHLLKAKRTILVGSGFVLTILAVDIALNARPRVPWASADQTWPTTPVVEFLRDHAPAKNGRILCVGSSFPADMNIPHGLAFLDSYSAMQIQSEARFLEAAKTPVTPSGKKTGFWELTDQFSPRLLNLASVRYLLIPGDWTKEAQRPATEEIVNVKGQRFHQLYAAADGMILECLDAHPRVWLADTAKKGGGLMDLVHSADDLLITVFTESDADLAGSGGSAHLDVYTASSMTATVQVNQGDQMLVTSEIDSIYWQVLIDGVEAPIERVNGIFRGVRLKKGTHQVEFRAQPSASLLWGLGIAAIGTLLLLISLLRPIRLCRSTS